MNTCFEPIAELDAKVLVLGSFPGKESLRKQEYYAHPRNAFWYIIGKLFDGQEMVSYSQKTKILKSNRIALWDVLRSCSRQGSLDSSIDDKSILVNDFLKFFEKYREIQWVFFNGARAEKDFFQRIIPIEQSLERNLVFQRLPSTSPAMAALSREEKLVQWKVIWEKVSMDESAVRREIQQRNDTYSKSDGA